MNHGIDAHAGLTSPIHRWDPRLKLLGLAMLAFAFAFIEDLALVPVMLATSVALVAIARLPVAFVAARLRYPGIFIILLGFMLPLTSGETVLARLGPLALRQEGVLDFLLIAGRFAAIVTIGLVIFATAPILTSIKALRALRLPQLLADMMLFSYRYLYELGDDLTRMRRATRLRGFRPYRPDRHTLSTMAALSGSMLVRSHERSTRIHQAMVLRGYGRNEHPIGEFRAGAGDVAALACAAALAIGFVLAEVGDIL